VTIVGYGDSGPLALDGGDVNAELVGLRQPGDVTALGRAASAARLGLARAAVPGSYERLYWSYPVYRAAREAIAELRPSLVIANDWPAVPAAHHAAQGAGAGLVVDLHEFGPRQWDNSWLWRTFRAPLADHVLRSYVSGATPTMTVCPSLARAYRDEYGFEPEVVYNAPHRSELAEFRPVDPDRVRLVHHGIAARERRLESMIEAVAAAGRRFSLDLMLVETDAAYVAELAVAAERLAPGRIRIVPPVAPSEIVRRVAEYDVGMFLLPPTTFNYAHALPNKFFDFVAAGLAVAVGPTPDMAAIAEGHGFGIVSAGFEPAAMAEALASQSPAAIDDMRRSARRAASVYNAEAECRKMRKLIGLAAA